MTDKLPSIDDFYEELPSKDEVIKEEKLPSINEFVEEEEEEVVEEKNKCKEGEYFCNDEQKCKPIPKGTRVRDDGLLVKEGDLVEVLNLINSVKNDIPEIPEIKYYDDELESLVQRVEEIQKNIPEVRYYDSEVEAICEEIDSVKHNIANLPEVKYYDEQLSGLEKRLVNLKESLPEVKYYDGDIQSLDAKIDKVRSEIPNFPKWINEVNEVPDFSWIGKTFSIIDDDFLKVGDNIKDLRDRFDADFQDLSESLDTKDFEQRVNLDEVKQDIKETKEKIFKELKEAAIKIWSHHDMFKDDDRKLKKQIFSKLNETKQKIEKQILDSRTKSYQENKELSNYFNGLQKEISNLPEVKYYDTPIQELKKGLSKLDEKIDNKLKDATLNIAELYKIVDELKDEQQLLVETNIPLGSDSPETNNPDPLTPIDQNFVTVDQLQKHYKLFVERVQYQLSSIGGGGAGFIKDLDDVDITGLADDYILQYDASTSKWKTVANTVGAGGTWTVGEAGIHTTKSVGIGTTARSDFKLYVSTGSTADTVAYFDGNISIAGSTFSREVVEIESLGIVTATKGVDIISGGVDITAGGLNVTAGVSTFSGIGTFGNSVFIDGDLRCVGVATFGSSSITIDGSNNKVNVGTGITIDAAAQTITVGTSKIADPTGDANYVGVVTAAQFVSSSGANISGIVTATSYQGDGSALTGMANTDTIAASSLTVSGITTLSNLNVTDISATGVTTVGIFTSYESISIGSTNLFTEISKKTSIGLALALG